MEHAETWLKEMGKGEQLLAGAPKGIGPSEGSASLTTEKENMHRDVRLGLNCKTREEL